MMLISKRNDSDSANGISILNKVRKIAKQTSRIIWLRKIINTL